MWPLKGKKSAETPTATGNAAFMSMLSGGASLRSYNSQFREAFAQNPYVYRCASLRASAVSSISPLLLDKEGNEIADKTHPLYTLLHHPTSKTSWRDLAYTEQINMSIGANAFIFAVKGIKPKELITLDPAQVSYMQTGDSWDPVRYWTYNRGTAMVNIPPEDMIHIHLTPRPGEILGMSPLEPSALSIANQTSAREWNNSMMNNSAKPSMVVSVPDPMDEDTFQTFRARLQGNNGGTSNTGKIMVMDGGKTVTPIGYTAVEMDYNAGIVLNAREISCAMGVPPELVGDSANKTYSNAQEANKEFARHTVVPQLTMLFDALSIALCPYYPDVARIAYDAADVAELKDSMTELVNAAQAASFLTVNEKRAMMGYDDIGPDGDIILMPMGNIPLNEAVMSTPDIGEKQ